MKYLNAEELVELVQQDGMGQNYRFFSFKKITNSPAITINIETGKVKSCTCKHSSIHGESKHCRYTLAVLGYLEKE